VKRNGEGVKGSTARLESFARRRCAEQLAACEKAWRAGLLLAVTKGLEICRLYRQPPPGWIVGAVAKVVKERMTKFERRRYRQDLIHYERFDAVRELRERRHELAKLGDNRGASWERAYDAVSDLLKGTRAAGSADTVKASYQYVQTEFKAGRAGRFMITP
jgi:hypothetical protein